MKDLLEKLARRCVLGHVGQASQMRAGSPRDRASWYEVRFIRSTKPISGVISHGLDELCYVSFLGQGGYRAGVLAPSEYSRDNVMVRGVYEVVICEG